MSSSTSPQQTYELLVKNPIKAVVDELSILLTEEEDYMKKEIDIEKKIDELEGIRQVLIYDILQTRNNIKDIKNKLLYLL